MTLAQPRPPNFIVILCDDLGYSDIEPYGGSIPTPSLNRMAAEGFVATDYYAPANICTPSRAGLLTGRYPIRTGLAYEVIFPGEDRHLPHSEKTIADALRPTYVSGFFGKWHLGHSGTDWMPTSYGFETFFGIPYSHDMEPLQIYGSSASGPAVSSPVELPSLQQQFCEHAEQFIEDHQSRPFFALLALSSPHLPAHPYGDFHGSSHAGSYGDVVLEIDSIVGRILDRVTALGLERDTVIVFTSDNGPWYEGSSTPLRDRKGGMAYDGGFRVPCIVWAPSAIEAGSRSNAIMSGMDFLPTFCAMAGIDPPQDVKLDGQDVTAALTNGAPSPHEEILLFNNEDVVGIRTQRWKYVTHTYYRGLRINLERQGYQGLYDMDRDISESYSVATLYADVAADMTLRVTRAREMFEPLRLGVPPYLQALAKQGAFAPRD